MKLGLRFGISEPQRTINWWQSIKDFPYLVLFKGKKWEFFMYEEDKTKQTDYICHFGEIQSYDPNFHATTYVDLSNYFTDGWGPKCECGSVYSSLPQGHMFYCPKWTKL